MFQHAVDHGVEPDAERETKGKRLPSKIRLSTQIVDVVRASDTGTLQYEIYLSEDQSECIVLERYRDSAAVIEHAAHVGELSQALFATGSASSDLLGEPSAELAALIAGSGISVFRPLLSFSATKGSGPP